MITGKKAVIFDMDGVLVDSEPVIEAAAIAGLKEYGVDAEPEDFKPFIGAGEDRYIGGVSEKYGVPYKLEMKDRVYEIYLEIVDNKLKVFSGTADVLKKLNENNYKLALASSADKVKIKANLRVADIPRTIFASIISGEEVTNTKPDPEIYKKSADSINMPPDKCVVVEDAVHGVEAARAAGMTCIALTTSFTESQLKKAGADYICSKIDEITPLLIN